MKTTILIDSAFFIKRVYGLKLVQDPYDAQRIADLVMRYSLLHLKHAISGKEYIDDLYRIFFTIAFHLKRKCTIQFLV